MWSSLIRGKKSNEILENKIKCYKKMTDNQMEILKQLWDVSEND